MRAIILLAASCLVGLMAPACQVVADAPIAAGIGTPCTGDSQCHAARCVAGLCTKTCLSQADCPQGSLCTANQLCELSVRADFIYVGVVEDFGWTLTHELGRQYAMKHVPYLQSSYVPSTFLPKDAAAAIDKFVADGTQLIIATSFSLRNVMVEKAKQYPNIAFTTCSSGVVGSNLGSYFGRMEQAYYLAGVTAAKATATNRLGFLGSFITPEVVRHINAFTLGARTFSAPAPVRISRDWARPLRVTSARPPPSRSPRAVSR